MINTGTLQANFVGKTMHKKSIYQKVLIPIYGSQCGKYNRDKENHTMLHPLNGYRHYGWYFPALFYFHFHNRMLLLLENKCTSLITGSLSIIIKAVTRSQDCLVSGIVSSHIILKLQANTPSYVPLCSTQMLVTHFLEAKDCTRLGTFATLGVQWRKAGNE